MKSHDQIKMNDYLKKVSMLLRGMIECEKNRGNLKNEITTISSPQNNGLSAANVIEYADWESFGTKEALSIPENNVTRNKNSININFTREALEEANYNIKIERYPDSNGTLLKFSVSW